MQAAGYVDLVLEVYGQRMAQVADGQLGMGNRRRDRMAGAAVRLGAVDLGPHRSVVGAALQGSAVAVCVLANAGVAVPGGIQAVVLGQTTEDDLGRRGIQMTRILGVFGNQVAFIAGDRPPELAVFQVGLVRAYSNGLG
jgi:hypothetical protein